MTPFLIAYWKPVTIAVVFAASCAWSYVKGSDYKQAEWDAENAMIAQALAVAFEKSAKETEEIRKVFVEYKKGTEAVTSGLERDVADGVKRLQLKARCVPVAADAGRAGSGTAELDADARPTYYALRRGLDDQRALLNFCRAELKKRSAKNDPIRKG